MVIKKIFLILIFLSSAEYINAQSNVAQKALQPDSIFADSLKTVITPDSLQMKKYTLKEVEKRVRLLEDTFFNVSKKTFYNNTFYNFGNNYYSLPYQQRNFNIFGLNFNNLSTTTEDLLSLLNYYNIKKNELANYELSSEELDFKPTLSAFQFSSGSYNYETRYIDFQKNDFFNFCDAKLFIHNGKNKSFWGSKNYFDDIVLQAEKQIYSHKISLHILKQFSKYDKFNFANPNYNPNLSQHYLRKAEISSQILNLSLFNNFVDFSYLHQKGNENIFTQGILKNKNRFSRDQFNFMIHLPIENYETDISLRADINNYKHQNYNEKIKDYFITIKNNSPGPNNLFLIQVINQIYFSDIYDTTYIYPQILFDIPINENLKTNLCLGVKGYQPTFYIMGSDILGNDIKTSFANFTANYKLSKINLTITPFVQQIKFDSQWTLNNDSLTYKEIEEYDTYGLTALCDANCNFLSTQNKFSLNFNFTKRPDNISFRPNFRMKLLWEIREDVHHNNFLYAISALSYLKDFRNIELEKEKDEIFLDIECGININRFRISVLFKNILNQDYFMDEHNLINGYGTYLQVHWNFIN